MIQHKSLKGKLYERKLCFSLHIHNMHYSSSVPSISDFRSLSESPLQQSDWVEPVCSDVHRLEEKYATPTASLLQGLMLLGKQVVQGNHMHMEACSRAHRPGYSHMHSHTHTCVTPTLRHSASPAVLGTVLGLGNLLFVSTFNTNTI